MNGGKNFVKTQCIFFNLWESLYKTKSLLLSLCMWCTFFSVNYEF